MYPSMPRLSLALVANVRASMKRISNSRHNIDSTETVAAAAEELPIGAAIADAGDELVVVAAAEDDENEIDDSETDILLTVMDE